MSDKGGPKSGMDVRRNTMRSLLLLLLAPCLAPTLANCEGGNSGAEGEVQTTPPPKPPSGPMALPVPCPCGSPLAKVALRVTVVSDLGNDALGLRVEEVLNGEPDIQPGEILEANWSGSAPCLLGCPDIGVGDDALAFYWVEVPACEAQSECFDACQAQNAENGEDPVQIGSECSETWLYDTYPMGKDCRAECKQAVSCSERPAELRGQVRLAIWADPLILASGEGGELAVAADELGLIWDASAGDRGAIQRCEERFGSWTDVAEERP